MTDAEYQAQMNAENYREARSHAVATGTLKSFQQCVSRVQELHESCGGGDPTTVGWSKPWRWGNDPMSMIEFQTAGLHGGIAIRGDEWSVNT